MEVAFKLIFLLYYVQMRDYADCKLLCAYDYNSKMVDNIHFSTNNLNQTKQQLKQWKHLSREKVVTWQTYEQLSSIVSDKINFRYETCKNRSAFCYAFWTSNLDSNSTAVLGQGCLIEGGEAIREQCGNQICAHSHAMSLKNTRFCCCQTHFCNVNFVDNTHLEYNMTTDDDYYTEYELEMEEVTNTFDTNGRYLLWIALVLISIVILAIIVFLSKFANSKQIEEISNKMNTKQLTLEKVIGQGNYGCVWSARQNTRQMAVKIMTNRQIFANEIDIYQLPHMTHANLLSYFGCDHNLSYRIFLSLEQIGNLREYLKVNTLEWNTFCLMGSSIAKALDYLHTPVMIKEMLKPVVCHGDLTSLNILVKEDLSCCICDFSLARVLDKNKPIQVKQLGTVQYLSPEVLEGVINLIDGESAFKQIDIYAMGVVLWELATRTNHLFDHLISPEYQIPFEQQLGREPTLENTRKLICDNNGRLMWPTGTRIALPEWAVIDETIEYCCERDPEARLTALCVQQRIEHLIHK